MIWRWLRKKLGLVRPPREAYVRTSRMTAHAPWWTVEPGIEFRPGDDFEFMTGLMHDICVQTDRVYPCSGPTELAESVAELITRVYPDRAYFVEVHGDAGWVQIYQPFGLPRNDL